MPDKDEELLDEELLSFGDSAPKKEFEPVEEGEYEVEIESFKYRTTSTGKRQLNFKLRIREDVEQRNKGRYLFHAITEKEGDRAFNFYRIDKLLTATKNCPDYREKFANGFDEVLQYLIGRQFRLETTIEDDSNGKPQNRVDDDTFTVSKWNALHPATAKKEEDTSPTAGSENLDKLEVEDSDLPF